jgi:FkbM family methyltransferase
VLIPLAGLAERRGVKVERVVHAGAHLAEEASAYRDVGAEQVLWVEGNPDLIGRISEIVAPFGHKVAQALLGAESGREVTFHVTNFDSMSSSVLEFGTHQQQSPEVVVVGDQVHTLQTLDEVARANGFMDADFLNLDLQGYELECLKGAAQLIASIQTVYTEVNVDQLYKGCVLLPELDAWLNQQGFEAAELVLAGKSRRSEPGFVGWGDACYVRVDSPRSFADLHADDAADWFRAAESS